MTSVLGKENRSDWNSQQLHELSDVMLGISKNLRKFQKVYCKLPSNTLYINTGAQEMENGFARIVSTIQYLKGITDDELGIPTKKLGILMDSDIKAILEAERR